MTAISRIHGIREKSGSRRGATSSDRTCSQPDANSDFPPIVKGSHIPLTMHDPDISALEDRAQGIREEF
jgi:hypothetical protein